MAKEKPFYLRPPWEILFKETKLEKVSPWSIDLAYLLTTLLEEMSRVGIDFRAAGMAINSSVLIYLKKAELLLKMEEPPREAPRKVEVYLPPPIDLPFRFEFTTTTVNDLIAALERALLDERRRRLKPKLPTLPPPIPELTNFEAYLHEIEERSDDLYKRLKTISRGGEPLTLSDIVTEWSWHEVVRVFLMLLFLAQRERIDLYQDEEETDIKVIVLEDRE